MFTSFISMLKQNPKTQTKHFLQLTYFVTMSVYSTFIGLLSQNNIKSKVKSKFEALHDTPSKVKYILSLLEEYDLVFEIEARHPKNDAVSKLHPDAANNLYREGKFVDALIGYNKALCFASAESLSLGYANRSAAYLELKLYDACLQNIRLAREAGYPAKLMSKLVDREKKCLEELGKVQAKGPPVKKFEIKLSYPASVENPCVADCIELVVNNKYGRHFVAKQSLKVGDIVIVDRPHQVYLFNEFNSRTCANCVAENRLNLIPCPGCTKTMFCSRSCLESANKFHKTFCPIIEGVFEQTTSNLFFSLRILLSHIHDFGSVKALAAAEASRSEKNGWPKCDHEEMTIKQSSLDEFLDMAPGLEVLNIKKAISLGLTYTWLMKHTDMAAQLKDLESQDLFLDRFYRYNKLLDINAYGMDVLDRSESGSKTYLDSR
jgi:SET and MYND domain-containing protein 4